MTTLNLVDLNVDQLFEQHNVGEIDAVHKKIQAVVEQKREELRTMVGERYRDLLKAADTITTMQESSSTLISQIDCISANCRSLNEQQLIGFKTNDTADLLRSRNANKQLNNYFSTMVQIKLLTSLPELIWSQLDQEHFFKATELFIFSRHISTGLQLDASNPLMQQLPVAKRQWEILRPFHVTIKQHVLNALEREVLSSETAADCLLSLLLLEKQDLNGVLKTLLQLRSSAFLNCLREGGNGELHNQPGKHRRVKERLLASLKVLNGCIELIAKCFMDNGLLYQKLAVLGDSSSVSPTITLLDSSDAQCAYLLPDIIANFRPKLQPLTLDKQQVRLQIEQWLAEIDRIALEQLQQLFELVTTLHTIQEIKHAANAEKKLLNIAPLAEQLQLGSNLDFYEKMYAPLINQRVRNIIEDSWTQAINTTYASLQEAIENKESLQAIDIWTEQTTDLPLSLAEALSEDLKIKHLLMKTKGYDQRVIGLCSTFDSKLGNIINELNTLLDEQSTKLEDKRALIEFLAKTAEKQMLHFVEQLKELHLEAESVALLFVVRACTALLDLCPNLRNCFWPSSNWRQWLGAGNANNTLWTPFCAMLEGEIYQFWTSIVDNMLKDHHCSKHMLANMTPELALEEFVHWESITLEEHENALNSTFRIPKQPSSSLQLYLFSLIRSLKEVVPQTLPPKVLNYFNYRLLTQLMEHYGAQLNTEAVLMANVSFQLYFDLKFLQYNFNQLVREHSDLRSQLQQIQNGLKANIDPFDFELFDKYLIANAKAAVLHLNCALGVLTPPTAATATSSTSSDSGSTMTISLVAHEKEPNVLSLSSCGSTSLWFPLLPIVSSSTTTSGLEAKRSAAMQELEDKSSPSRNRGTASTRSSTTAKSKSFFGAMSQEWFR